MTKIGPVRGTQRGRPGWRCTMTSRAAPCELQGRPSYTNATGSTKATPRLLRILPLTGALGIYPLG